MTYNIQIFWGTSVDDFQKSKIRKIIEEILNELNLLPCWKETKRKKIINSYLNLGNLPSLICVNGHKVISLNRDAIIPTKVEILERVKNFSTFSKRRVYLENLVSILSGFLIAIFPKCPVCWATYMSIFGIASSSSIPYEKNILYFIVLIAFANLGFTFYKIKATKNFTPIFLQIIGYIIILLNRNYFDSQYLIVCGIGLLFLSSLITHFKFKTYLSLIKKQQHELN